MLLTDDEKMWIVLGLLAKTREYMDWMHHPHPKSTDDIAKTEQELADLRALAAKVLDSMGGNDDN